ncbi:MAG: hypothetical protein Q9207_001264 [Kuettlingeria erythrocarpa]
MDDRVSGASTLPPRGTSCDPMTLEGLLRNRQEDGHSAVDDHEQTENTPSDGSGSDDEPTQSSANKRGPSDKRCATPQPDGPSTDTVAPNMHPISGGLEISELMRADLDHLYFERVHPIVPILQKHGYYSWANGSTPDIHRRCLRSAMWTLAMSLSTQFENMREMMYAETRQMLEARDLGENDMVQVRIEQAQAWIMVTFYEFLRTNYRRAYISAGRVFRLVQLLRLHEVDSPTAKTEGHNAASLGDSVATEERRRNSHAAPMWFLSEAIASSNQFSPLAECAITATICGRVLSHNHVSSAEQIYGNAALDFWLRHEWLHGILVKRRDSLSFNYPSVSAFADPMLIFALMAVHATSIYLCEIAETSRHVEHYEATVVEYQNQALVAAREIARLSREQDQAHVFMPFAVFLSAKRLITHRRLNPLGTNTLRTESLDGELQGCMEALGKMQRMNNLAKHYLEILESEDFQGSLLFAVGQ